MTDLIADTSLRHPLGWIEGIDVAWPQKNAIDWQSIPDWVRFCWIKSSEANFRDATFESHVYGARSIGLRCGAYHFMRLHHDPIVQAELMAKQIKSVGEMELPPVIDVESDYWNPTVNGRPNPEHMPVAQVIERVRSFVDAIESLTDRRCVVYSGPYYWLVPPMQLAHCPHWVAHYYMKHNETHRPGRSAAWPKWTFWQFGGDANHAKIPGVRVACDRNYFNGTEDEFNQWLIGTYLKTTEPPSTIEDPMGEVGYQLQKETEQ